MTTRQAVGIPATRRSFGMQIRLAVAGAVVVVAAATGIAAHQLVGHTQHSQPVNVATNAVTAAGAVSRVAPPGGGAEPRVDQAAITANTATQLADPQGALADTYPRGTGTCGVDANPFNTMAAC